MKEPIFELGFAAGIDESQRPELLDPRAGWVALQNGRQNKRGGYSKRKGFTYQTLARLNAGHGDRSGGHKLFAHDKQTCVVDSTPQLEAHSTATSTNVPRGRVPECTLEMVPMVSSGQVGGLRMDGILCGNYYVRAYVVGTNAGGWDVYAVVLDALTGVPLRGPENLGSLTNSDTHVQLAKVGTTVIVFFGDAAALSQIQYDYISLTSASTIVTGWAGAAALTSDSADASVFSVCSLTAAAAIAYTNTSGGTSRVTLALVTPAGITSSQTINTNSTSARWVATQGSASDTLWVCWNEGTDVRLQGRNPVTIATTVATTATVATINTSSANGGKHALDVVLSSTAGAGLVVANDGAADRMHMVTFTTSGGGAVVAGGQTTVYNARRYGRPFRVGSRYYALCADWNWNTGPAAIVCDLTEVDGWVRPVASINPGLAWGYASAQASIESDGTTVHVPVSTISANEYTYGAATAKLDFASSQRWTPVRHAGRTFLSGGLLAVYDGHLVYESGFLVRPAKPTAADAGTGSGPNGTYRYVVVYEQVDKAGVWHASSVSDPSTITGTITDNWITVTLRPLSITQRQLDTNDGGVRLAVYRTLTGGEPPYYYVGNVSNDLSAATITYTDTTSDTTLATREKLYAPSLPGVNGGAQDRRPTPGLTHIASYNGMLVGAEGENLWYSGQDVAGEGTWFSPIFQLPVSGDGPITGLAAIDGTLFALKRRAVYAVAGEPPSDNGAAGGLGTPRRLAVDVGCIDARSIVVTGAGVFFQSERGIELLTRAQSVEWVGEKIQDTLASYPYVVAATLDPRESVVIFELSSSSTLTGGSSVAAVFDLSLGVWVSIDTRTSYAGSAGQRVTGGAVIWTGSEYRYAWLGADGRVRPEQDAHYDSGSGTTWVRQYARSGWVHTSGLQGYQVIDRVLLLADQSTDHDITIGVAHDYDDSVFVDKAWDSDALDALSTMWLDRDIVQSTGQAIMVELEDATPSGTANTVGTGAGGTWVALTFSGEPKSGVKRTAYTHRGGT
jgi:hypothetical protein